MTCARSFLSSLLALALTAGPAASASSVTGPRVIAVQPLGPVDRALVEAVASAARAHFQARVVVLPDQPLPASAFYAPRHRYRGERLLAALERTMPYGISKLLGVTSLDLSVTKGRVYDWGVMGVASLSQRAGVISTYRLRRGHAPSPLVERRAAQVAVHELGHTFGLPHCRTPRCIMNDAEGGIRAVDASRGEFCPACRLRLRGVARLSRRGPAPACAP